MKIDTLVLLVGAALVLFNPKLDLPFIVNPTPAPAPAPGPNIVPVNGSITQILAGQRADAQQVSAFYAAMADVVEKDQSVIKTNNDFYNGYGNAGALMFQGVGIKGKYPTLATTIDGMLKAAVPLEITPWTPDKRAAMVAALRNVSAQAAAVQ